MANELKPCPFCGSNFKISQEPIDNHPVGGMFYIFHEYGALGSEARKCKLDIRCHFDTEKEAVDFWNTRRAAPVEGLVTELWATYAQDGRMTYTTTNTPESGITEYVTRSQAEAIIAAERAEVSSLSQLCISYRSDIDGFIEQVSDLQTDNAALTARVKELEETVRDDIKFAKALETKLSSLTEQLKKVVAAWESLPGGRNYSVSVMQEWISGPMKKAIDNVRAALEVKP